MKTILSKAGLIAVAGLTIATVVNAAGGTPAATPTPVLTPQEMALESYNQGLEHRDKAWKLEKKMAEGTSGRQREKLEAKIDKEYGKAIQEFTSAIDNRPDFYQAHSSLGYARRKTGDFEGSLEAYNTALELAPDYTEAIEYRAEAHLGLGRVEDAKVAYLDLFARDRERADMLLTAMKGWAAERKDTDGGADAKVTDLEDWIVQREEIASQTAKLSSLESGRSW